MHITWEYFEHGQIYKPVNFANPTLQKVYKNSYGIFIPKSNTPHYVINDNSKLVLIDIDYCILYFCVLETLEIIEIYPNCMLSPLDTLLSR